MPDDNSIDTTGPVERLAPHFGSPLAGVGPESLKNIALQSRPLTDNESQSINEVFKGSIDPRDIRIAYDAGARGTTLGGYVIGKHLPTVIFLPTDVHPKELSRTEIHEATHVWQNLVNWKYTSDKGVPATGAGSNGERSAYLYDKEAAATKPFTDFGDEQQPEMVANNEASARAFVQSHKANRPFAGDMAFLDSIRSRYLGRDPVKYAESNPKSFSMVQREGGRLYMKSGNAVSQSTRSGDHNVVLENLRTKFPAYRGVSDGKLLAALLHNHPSYASHVGDAGLRLALETGHKPNSQ